MTNEKSFVTRGRLRMLGALPLAFFLGHLYFHWQAGTPGNCLWMCNASNVALGIGLVLEMPVLVRVATVWLIPGIPLWIFDVTQYGVGPWTTFLTHVGAVGIGLFAMSRVRGGGRWMWLQALAWFVVVQQAARMFTPPSLNVNTAHVVHSGVARAFPAYWEYWLATIVVASLCLFGLSFVLNKTFPPFQSET